MSEHGADTNRERNSTKTFIFALAIFILSISTFLLILNFVSKAVFTTLIPYVLLVLLLCMIALLVLLYRFFGAIKLINNSADLLSRGRLNISDIMADKTKGLELLTIAFNDMKANLLDFVESTKVNVIVLSDSIDSISKSLDTSYQGIEQTTSSMATVAEKAGEQLRIVESTLDGIKEVSERIENITDSLGSIDGFVGTTVAMATEGAEHLNKYNDHMKIISDNLTGTAEVISTLNSRLKEIDKVSGLIINITDQLQMLSLNSSIEAARAGEAGKGFVVVAQEMNKLSSATAESIGQINNLISNILDNNERVLESIGGCVESYNQSDVIFHSVKDSFDNINKNANILSVDMKKVYEESGRISTNTKVITERGTVLLDASNEISSITEEVASVTQEELAENSLIMEQANSLKDMLSGIGNLLSRYKTSVVPVEQNSSRRLKIVMISPLDHPFWVSVRQGALYAKNELKSKNVELEYVGLNPNSNEKMREVFAEKVEEGCDGIIIPGFLDGMASYVEKANRKNTSVITFNCDFSSDIKRLAYFGPNVNQAGTLAGGLLIKCCEGEGEIALFRGDLKTTINKTRRDRIMEALKKKKKIKVVAEIEAVDNDELVYTKAMEVMREFPNLKGFMITSGGAVSIARAIKDMGRTGKTKIVCFDYDKEILDLINKKIVYAAMGQDPFGQGHDPIVAMFNYLATNTEPEDINYTRAEIIDFRNAAR